MKLTRKWITLGKNPRELSVVEKSERQERNTDWEEPERKDGGKVIEWIWGSQMNQLN